MRNKYQFLNTEIEHKKQVYKKQNKLAKTKDFDT